MRLLIDEAVNGFVGRAVAAVHDALFVVTEGLSGQADEVVAAHALALGRIVITEDRNFSQSLLNKAARHPGIVVLELEGLRRDERIAIALTALGQPDDFYAGRITIVGRTSVRQRQL